MSGIASSSTSSASISLGRPISESDPLVGCVMLRSARACSQLSADRRALPVAFGVRIKTCLVRPPFHQQQFVWILRVLEKVELLAAGLLPYVSLKG